MLNKIKNQSGTSLIEVAVATGIFVIVLLIATDIFQTVLKSQNIAIASQNTQETLRYTLEVMSKEIRNARRSNDECELVGNESINRIYNEDANEGIVADGDIFYFKNKDNWCVHYYLDGGVLKIDRDDMAGGDYAVDITPDEIIVDNFEVVINDNEIMGLPEDKIQPYVTLLIEAHAKGHAYASNDTILQTTISSRMYE